MFLMGIAIYFSLLLAVSYVTTRKLSKDSYALADKKSHWLVIAIGMIGDSLSGISFLSVPGRVTDIGFSYFQMVLGYLVGYAIVARVLIPHYYRTGSPSIYRSLGVGLGSGAEILGSLSFILSRTLGAAVRLFLSITVLNEMFFKDLGVNFVIVAALVLGFILLYTVRGGMKTLIWTDVFQSIMLVVGLIASVCVLYQFLEFTPSTLWDAYQNPNYFKFTQVFSWDPKASGHFLKEFISGIFIVIVMTGLDQNIMQKCLTCESVSDAKKNLTYFSFLLLPINWIILTLGFMLVLSSQKLGIAIPESRDQLFPTIVNSVFPKWAVLLFLMGLIASTLSSADAVLTTLTTSFKEDILKSFKTKPRWTESTKLLHVCFTVLLLVVVSLLHAVPTKSAVHLVFALASYTYAPLLGLFILRWTKSGTYALSLYWYLASAIVAATLTRLTENLAFEMYGYKFNYETLIVYAIFFIACAQIASFVWRRDSRKLPPKRADAV